MALSEKKLRAVQELAERGIDGEKENAKKILKQHGYDSKTKTQIKAEERQNINETVINDFSFELQLASDILLLLKVLYELKIADHLPRSANNLLYVYCTYNQYVEIKSMMDKNRVMFDTDMQAHSHTIILEK